MCRKRVISVGKLLLCLEEIPYALFDTIASSFP